MEPMFGHIDADGDRIEFWPQPEGSMLVNSFDPEDIEIAPVRIPRDAVLRLHAALGEWLYPVHTPEWANKSLIEQMIEKAVKDQVAAVLPLHLKPGDRLLVADADGRVWADPEPHDVGHPQPAVSPCGLCGHEGNGHEDDCIHGQPPQHGRLMSELPRRTRPRPICVSCGHGWGEHTSGVCWGTSQTPEGVGCICTRERPGTTTAPCTCECGEHLHQSFGCARCTCPWTGTR